MAAGLVSFPKRGCRWRLLPPAAVILHPFTHPLIHHTPKHKNSAREEAIAIEMVKNLREKVSWCQREHPVTHYYDCADIVGKYLKLVKVREKEGGEGGKKVMAACRCVRGNEALYDLKVLNNEAHQSLHPSSISSTGSVAWRAGTRRGR